VSTHTLTVGDYVEILNVSVVGAQAAINVYHARVVQLLLGTPTDLDVAVAFDLAMSTRIKAFMGAGATYRGSSCRLLNQAATLPPAFSIANTGPGLVVGPLLPTQDRGLISWRTDLAGRNYRGRTYIPFVGDASTDSVGNPNGAYIVGLTDIGNFWGSGPRTLINGVNQVQLLPVVYHRKAPKPPAVIPVKNTGTPITGFVVRNAFGTQRRSGTLGRPNNSPF
jgi:hypothetical protein